MAEMLMQKCGWGYFCLGRDIYRSTILTHGFITSAAEDVQTNASVSPLFL